MREGASARRYLWLKFAAPSEARRIFNGTGVRPASHTN